MLYIHIPVIHKLFKQNKQRPLLVFASTQPIMYFPISWIAPDKLYFPYVDYLYVEREFAYPHKKFELAVYVKCNKSRTISRFSKYNHRDERFH